MTAHDRRMVFVLALAAALAVSLAAGTVLLSQRPTVEILVTDVGLVNDTRQNGMTEIRAHLVLRNVGASAAHFKALTLFAHDPTQGTLFDTFVRTEVRLEPAEARTSSETTNVTGHWSEVAFTVKVFPNEAPSWERALEPDRSVT